MPIPLKITGNAKRTLDEFINASMIDMVVFESAIHL